MERREVYYFGRVQGVGFRYTARAVAKGFRVAGFVRNLSDGRVQLVVEGTPEEIDRFLAAIDKQMGHYIHHVQQSVSPASGAFKGFEIRF